MPNSGGDKSLFWSVAAGVVALDVVTKIAAVAYLSPIPQPVLGRVLQFQLVYNPGAAFGINIGAYSRWIFAGLAVVALLLLLYMMRHTRAGDRLRLGALGLISGGAVGNLLDRVRNPRGVVDFLDVGFAGLRWPTFNLADVAVMVGAFLLAGLLWRDGRTSLTSPGGAPTSSPSPR